jgi:hypothetical protein
MQNCNAKFKERWRWLSVCLGVAGNFKFYTAILHFAFLT